MRPTSRGRFRRCHPLRSDNAAKSFDCRGIRRVSPPDDIRDRIRRAMRFVFSIFQHAGRLGQRLRQGANDSMRQIGALGNRVPVVLDLSRKVRYNVGRSAARSAMVFRDGREQKLVRIRFVPTIQRSNRFAQLVLAAPFHQEGLSECTFKPAIAGVSRTSIV